MEVSALIAAYKASFLAPAIESALGQTHDDLEVVLVDDCPTDAVAAVAARYDTNPRFRYFRNESAPLGAARSHARAIAEARGRVLGIINDDDWWEPTLVERLLGALDGAAGAVVAFADHWVINDGERDLPATNSCSRRWGRARLAPGRQQPFFRTALVDKSIPSSIAALFLRDVVASAPIPEGVGGAYDYYLSYVLCRGGAAAVYVPERLANWRVHGTNLTSVGSCERAEEEAAALRIAFEDPRTVAVAPDLRRAYADSLWVVATRHLRDGSRLRAIREAGESARLGRPRALILAPIALLPRSITRRLGRRTVPTTP